MTNLEMLKIVLNQLAIDLNCTPIDLNGDKDSFVFVERQKIIRVGDLSGVISNSLKY